jgi:primosomal protein N' (replication factor Y)
VHTAGIFAVAAKKGARAPQDGCVGPIMSKEYAEIIVDVAAFPVDREFHYHVPPSLQPSLKVGHRVLVPFGRRRVAGYVVGFSSPPEDVREIRDILRILDEEPLITPTLLELAHWMSDYYGCLLVEAISCMLPPGARAKGPAPVRTLKAVRLTGRGCLGGLGPKQELALELIRRAPGQTLTVVSLEEQGIGRTTVQSLVKRDILQETRVVITRRPDDQALERSSQEITLTPEQERALAAITDALGQNQVFVLHGVTGSGKTEVYLRAIASALRAGLGALVLVPEIALTAQIMGEFQARFGDEVALLHSNLSLGERHDEWLRLRRGEARVVVGARSAVFAPVQDLGLIVIDEEHEPSYKQDDRHPRYHARTVAMKRAELENAVVVLGSATPGIESYYRSKEGSSKLLILSKRVENLPLPKVEIVDMRDELKRGNRTVFSRRLQRELARCLGRGEQAILFLNRRGYTTFIFCRECGEVMRCADCSVSMTYHQPEGELRCHYCGNTRRPPQTCPACGSQAIRHFGAGTQRVVEALQELFPRARAARLDADVTSRKGAHAEILRSFAARKLDVLVGTQMVAKGFDFPGVTLVGVVAADTILNLPDYRSSERTFQLLVQAAGRAGRGPDGGVVVIQTYNPQHYAVLKAAEHDYEAFYRRELSFRESLHYPPFCRLVRLLFQGESEAEVQRTAHLWSRLLGPKVRPRGWEMFGPAPAPLSRLRDRYRWHLWLKVPPEGPLPIKELLGDCAAQGSLTEVNLSIDVEPSFML